jgi:hypothetical protein
MLYALRLDYFQLLTSARTGDINTTYARFVVQDVFLKCPSQLSDWFSMYVGRNINLMDILLNFNSPKDILNALIVLTHFYFAGTRTVFKI